MDILIRGLSPEAAKLLERLAKDKGFNSRNSYIVSLLEDLTFLEKTNLLIDRMEKQLIANNAFMAQTGEALNNIQTLLQELMMHDDSSDRS